MKYKIVYDHMTNDYTDYIECEYDGVVYDTKEKAEEALKNAKSQTCLDPYVQNMCIAEEPDFDDDLAF